jgi:hypothetical protein
LSVNQSGAKARRRVAERAREGRFRRVPRLVIRAHESSLTPSGGGAVLGELVRQIELIALDAAIETAPRIGPGGRQAARAWPLAGQTLGAVRRVDVVRRRLDARSGATARQNAAGEELRAVPGTPATSTACQLAPRLWRWVHEQVFIRSRSTSRKHRATAAAIA